MFSSTSLHWAAADVPDGGTGVPDGGAGPATDVLEREDTDLRAAADRPWQVIVWNDPINLMSYVSYVFRSYFGFSREKADALMLQVHQEGKAIVASGGREEAERHVQAMHGYGLWATLQHDQGEGS
ncbi:ATP-dependent Clp protease adapter ClpS [Citricoccus sp. GCM10030269]|uniref:ATP-dependent Clp protease adapter ClpS n=1 Tax=Citricoccus sp. GCM10030269 TaxID=3273388 RepID=UPI003611649F